MLISRRNLLGQIGLGAVVTTAAPPLAGTLDRISDSGLLPGTFGPIRLYMTHNAYGASGMTIAAMQQALSVASRYPDTGPDELREKIATLHGVGPEQVVLGCGSGDILRMAATAFTGPQMKLVLALPTFELVGQYAARAGATVIAVPLRRDYSHDLDAMLAQSDSSTGLVYICNPNNPTGSLTPRKDLNEFLDKLPASTHVVIDEAYHHYVEQSSDYASFIDRPVGDNRVIVARSFSKIYGLAGMRVGYAITSLRTASRLASCRLDGNVNVIAAKAAVAGLNDGEYVQRSSRININDRQEFLNHANARMLRTIESHTNFVMLNTEQSAREIVEHFRKNNILLAPPFAPLSRHVRISLGTPAEMREFWRVWDLMPRHPGHRM